MTKIIYLGSVGNLTAEINSRIAKIEETSNVKQVFLVKESLYALVGNKYEQ